MASGDQQNPSKGSLHSSENNTSNTGLGDNQWTFSQPPPNNLDLNSHPKPTKKHRNKEKVRSATTPVPNSAPPTCVDHNSANSLTTHGFPHAKFTTASWLNDQLGSSGMFTKNEESEADEQSSDVEHSINQRRNGKISVNQRLQSGRLKDHPLVCTQKDSVESENKKSIKEDNTKKADSASIFERLRQLRECILQVNYIMPSLENSDEPRMIQQAEKMKSIREDLLDKERLLQMHFLQATDQSSNTLNKVASTEPVGSKRCHHHRDTVHGDDEDKANIQNHFLEQVKESQEKLAALKQQQALLVSWQKQAEDKLATFHAQLAKSNPDQVHSDLECQYASSERSVHSGVVDDCTMNDDSEWENDVYQKPKFQKPSMNTQKLQNSGQEILHPPVRQMDIQEQSNEHRKPWSQVIQDLSDKNLSEPVSDDDIEVTDVRKTLAEVEWKRKKLKNKLTELQEKKLLNDKLMVELSSLNEAAKCVGVGKFSEDEDTFSGSASHDNQHFGSIEEKKRKIEELQNTLLQLRGMMDDISPAANPEVSSSSSSRRESKESTPMNFTVASSPRNIPVARKNRQASSVKKDNISKEQCSGFPARRHYEAEGRANEDADLPSAVVTSNPPAPEQNSWDNDSRIQEKIRKIQEAQSKLKKIQGLMNSIEESRRSGQHIPSDYLQLLQSLEDEVKTDELNASNSEESDEDRDDDDVASINENCSQTAVVTSAKEIGDEKAKSLVPVDSRSEQSEQLHNQEEDLESLINERERLLKIHVQYVQLQNSLPSLQRTNNDHVRSSGEGGNLQKKKPHRSNVQALIKDSHQAWIGKTKDNLLTRQNVATMESQTRNGSDTLRPSRESVMVKKENINNLSGKLPKHAPNSSVHSESLTQGNNDAFSTLSTELNRSLSLQDDFKLELNDIMVRKRQMYSSNQPSFVHSCSSVNSELEGSNSAIAPDNTIAATWGGSSTQDNFEDEGEEAIESLEEQDDEDENENHNDEAAKNVLETRQNIASLNHFPREGVYVDRVCSINEKTRNNCNKGGIQTNQCSMKSNLPQAHNNNRGQIVFNGSRPETYIPAEVTAEPGELEPPLASASDSIMGPALSSNFFQQVEQLNALCYSILEQQALPQNHQRNLFCPLPLPNSCRPTHPVPDVVHHYTQQLQLQQQLLLNLSQCYHALYMQQLEIQHLQRYMQQNSDPETAVSGNATNLNAPVASTDDFTFRPWYLSPWLSSGIPSMPHAASQVSPMSAPPFLQPPQQSFTFSPPAAASNSPPCTLVSGIPQTRTVPVDQELRPNPETLNNRVPPRTRANNFLDNFRSYTRQNLLSAPHNNTRSNEYNGTAAVTHTRQFPTSVSNSANWNCNAATEQIPNSENAIPALQSAERSSERPPANPDLQEMMTRTKKFNLNKPQTTSYPQNNPDTFRRPVASLNTLAPTDQVPRSNPVHALNLESFVPSNLTETSVNLAQPYPLQQKSKIGQFPSASMAVPPPSSSSSELVHESIYSEVSKLVSKNEFQPGSLRDFFQELQNLRSDGLQKALKTVKEMVKTEKSGCSSAINDDKIKNNNNEPDHNVHDNADQLPGSNHDSIEVAESRSNELHFHRQAVDASKQWNNHSLPTATIPPLNKTHVPKCSTGAVKKKASCKTAYACNFVSNIAHDSQDTNVTVSATNANLVRDSSELLVETIAFDIIPYLQNHLSEDCCPSFRSKLSSRIMDVFKANYSFPLPCAFLLQLHQNLNLVIAKYSGLRVCDCESDLVKNVAEMLFKELTSYKSGLQRHLENGDTSGVGVISEINHQSDAMSQTSKLTVINEKKRPSAASKDVPEISRTDSNFTSAEVADDGLCDNLLKISVDDSSNSLQHLNGILQQEPVRGAVGGEMPYVLHNSNWSIVTGNPEEDMGYECDPEAEPGVEAETEADLAEADQSPGPQGASSSALVPEDACQIDGLGTSGVATANSQIWKTDGSLCSDEQAVADVGVVILQDTVASFEDAIDQEINSDDIPTRLTPPFCEEELQMHIKNEQDSIVRLADVVEDFTLAGDGFFIKEPVSHT